jgi:hypothetical protein
MESKLADNIDNNAIAQNVGSNTQQIFMPKNTPVHAPVAAVGANIQNGAPTLSVTVPEVGMLSGHISLFGYEISKMTLLILVIFVAIVSFYFYYNKKSNSNSSDSEESSKSDKKSKKNKKKSKSKVEDKESSAEESD